MTHTELETCITQYGTAIYSFCRQLTQNRQEADDLYQDTFLKATELSSKINYKDNPKSYLLSVALRIWKNKKRKFAWRMRIAPMHPITGGLGETAGSYESSPEDQVLKKEEAALIQQAVGNLPERLKIPILLFYMEELSVYHHDGSVRNRFCPNYPIRHSKKQVISGQKNIKKRIGGNFR